MYGSDMKIAIFGSNGFLGGYFKEQYPEAITPRIDIADAAAVRAFLDAEKPDVVINCAGKTGRPNVDWCEDHKLETIKSNVTGPLVLLDETQARGMYLVHIGSGCIYQGDNHGKGWTETDPPNFYGSFYSRTKLWSDQMLKDFPVLNIRLRMPFDGSQNPRNLIMKLRSYSRVLDEPNSITHLPDLLKTVDALISQTKTGTYNMVNPGAISPYRVMELYKEIVDPTHEFERLALSQLGDVVKAGRSNCLLSTAKLASEHMSLPTSEDAVRFALAKMKAQL
jgi:dTDP-4-dehydrorhamnose reductase